MLIPERNLDPILWHVWVRIDTYKQLHSRKQICYEILGSRSRSVPSTQSKHSSQWVSTQGECLPGALPLYFPPWILLSQHKLRHVLHHLPLWAVDSVLCECL